MSAQVVRTEFVIVHEGDFANPCQGKMFGHAGPYRATAGNNDVTHVWFSACTSDQVPMILPL
ncbi:hypothetical protein PSMEN_15175 [Ectopseudomonas mendocina]|nr:hypothetical protein PSMEN_15175 [Pseudomonas mendocina]